MNDCHSNGRPQVSFVGAGPGDPELITVKGLRRLREAERVVYAGSLVPKTLLDECAPGTEIFDSASLTLEETHALIVAGVRAGQRVVRLHTGDPSLYGAIQEQMTLLDREGIPYEVIPGVSAVFAAAARIQRQLTLPEVSQTLILTRAAGRTPVPPKESLADLARHQATLAIYLSVSRIEEVVKDLRSAYPPSTPVVVAYRIGWPDEKIIVGELMDIALKVREAGIRRQAVILVGEVLAPDRHGTRSRLYDGAFSHGFRNRKE